MPRGNQIKHDDLTSRLPTLDIDEGIRIENAGDKMFVNRNASGIFVVQFENDFLYLQTARQVISAVKSRFPKKYTVWAY